MADGGEAYRRAFGVDPDERPSRAAARPLMRPGAREAPAPGTRVSARQLTGPSEPQGRPGPGTRASVRSPIVDRARGIVRDTTRSSGSKPDDSPHRIAQAQAFISANRRQLSQQEFDALDPRAQQRARLNTKLFTAWDADRAEGSRSEMTNLVSQLGLSEKGEKAATRGVGVPFVSTEGDLAGTAKRPGDVQRQEKVSSLSSRLAAILEKTDTQEAKAAFPAAVERGGEYKFADEMAKTDFEASFDLLLEPEGIKSIDWATGAKYLADLGYDPEDFRQYALDRVQLLPNVPGRINKAALDAWFGR